MASTQERLWSGATLMVGHNIYVIGGLINNTESNSVRVIDCRSHTWSEAPSMHMARALPSACVLDGKIYVTGGCTNLDSTNLMEVYNTKTQAWEFLQIPSDEICKGPCCKYESIGHEGTVYVMCEATQEAYKLNKGKWRAVDLAMKNGLGCSRSYCVIENVFYRCDSLMKIDWYDPKERAWKTLKGLERLPRIPSPSTSAHIILTNCGRKMAVLWEEYVSSTDKQQQQHHQDYCKKRGRRIKQQHQDKLIWCAEIAIEKGHKGEIWGTLDWFDVVCTTNEQYSLVHAFATTI